MGRGHSHERFVTRIMGFDDLYQVVGVVINGV